MSREGVQRDLLPNRGNHGANQIWFCQNGSHSIHCLRRISLIKPSDLVPELQGRLPIRVELNALKPSDFCSILTEPDHSLVTQYEALLKTDGITIEFVESGIEALAEIASLVNEKTENIGARRLHTLVERVLEDLLFQTGQSGPETVTIDRSYVESRLSELSQDEDLSQYIL